MCVCVCVIAFGRRTCTGYKSPYLSQHYLVANVTLRLYYVLFGDFFMYSTKRQNEEKNVQIILSMDFERLNRNARHINFRMNSWSQYNLHKMYKQIIMFQKQNEQRPCGCYFLFNLFAQIHKDWVFNLFFLFKLCPMYGIWNDKIVQNWTEFGI